MKIGDKVMYYSRLGEVTNISAEHGHCDLKILYPKENEMKTMPTVQMKLCRKATPSDIEEAAWVITEVTALCEQVYKRPPSAIYRKITKEKNEVTGEKRETVERYFQLEGFDAKGNLKYQPVPITEDFDVSKIK